MKKEEFMDRIKIREVPSGDSFIKTIEGGLVFKSSIQLQRGCQSEIEDRAAQQIKEALWREIYGDRRKEFAEKMYEFLRLSFPGPDFEKWNRLKNELMELASAQ